MEEIEVTVISSVISDRGQKKIEEHSENMQEVLTEEQCENLGIPYTPIDDFPELEKEDFDIIERQFFVPIDKIITYGYAEFTDSTEMFLIGSIVLSLKEKPTTIRNRVKKARLNLKNN